MQGTKKLYLVHQPFFYKTNGRHQLIIGADIQSGSMGDYAKARKAHPEATFILASQMKKFCHRFWKEECSWLLSRRALMSMYFIQIGGQMFIPFFLEESFINAVYNRTNLLKDVIPTHPYSQEAIP